MRRKQEYHEYTGRFIGPKEKLVLDNVPQRIWYPHPKDANRSQKEDGQKDEQAEGQSDESSE